MRVFETLFEFSRHGFDFRIWAKEYCPHQWSGEIGELVHKEMEKMGDHGNGFKLAEAIANWPWVAAAQVRWEIGEGQHKSRIIYNDWP